MSGYQPRFDHSGPPRFDGTDPAKKVKKPHRFLRWLTKTLTTALIITLVLVLLPYAARYAADVLGGADRDTQRVSQLLTRQLQGSAMLETATVDEEGQLVATVEAALLGEVQRVTIQYDYHLSLGIDLAKVQVRTGTHLVTLVLPPVEVLSDSITPVWVDRQDFWYPLTETRRQNLLAAERETRRAENLAEAQASDKVWRLTTQALDGTVAAWLADTPTTVTLQYERMEVTADDTAE